MIEDMKINFKLQCSAILLIAAGYGWAGGHYIPNDANIFAYLFQLVVLGILLFLALAFLSLPEKQRLSRYWPIKGLTIFSILLFVITIANTIHGAYNSRAKRFWIA